MNKLFDGLFAADKWLIDQLETLVIHPVQRTFGFTSTHLTRLVLFIWLVANLLEDYFYLTTKHSWAFLAVDAVFVPLVLLGFEVRAKNRMRDAARGFCNAEKISTYHRFVRVAVVILFFFPPYRRTFQQVSFILYLYLLACDDLPPGISRVRKLWNRLFSFGGLKPIEEGV